ncbi:hypothetical protein MIND_01169900 [Mycena indigotica]|uniref:Transmembrane protein n=1 Tax=Mycena indigotica TaxID=2126181 RepID=A0A8H6S4L9_9AGAR|nr:uncharacterized protein MIND_01169900 [Mycena indigotica]KAF7292716.1 hypothetical protein MIND_01169900 [Mycena indigotica]
MGERAPILPVPLPLVGRNTFHSFSTISLWSSGMTTPRRIFVDDTDPSIHYSANQWFPHDVNQLKIGNLGPVWNGTTRSTIANGASMSFTFSGTSVSLLGSIIVTMDAQGNPDPTWLCTVDGIAISNGTNPLFNFPENNWNLCDQTTLLPGPHTLKVNIQTKGQPFYVDSIVYTPTPDVSIDGAVLEYTAGDPAITYGPGWQFYTVEDKENITQTNGAQVAFNFHGTAVALTGYIPHELAHSATTAKYSIDNEPATTFTLQGLSPEATTTLFNVPMFSVSSLSPGEHNVVVTYEGDSTKTPLPVRNFYVTNSTQPVPTTSSVSASFSHRPSNTVVAQPGGTKHPPAAAIAGAVVGSLLFLIVIAVLFWLLKRKKREEINRFTIDTMETGSGVNALQSRSQYGILDPYIQSEGQIHVATPSQATPYSYPYRSLRPRNDEASEGSSSSEFSSVGTESISQRARAISHSDKARELTPQRQIIIQRHQDSGVRLNSDHSLHLQPEIVDLPPDYSQD